MKTRPSSPCAVEFRALPSRVGQVRRIVCAQLRYWRLDPLIGPTALGVEALLAGVRRRSGADTRCTVEIELLRDRLKVSVRDHGPQLTPVRVTGEPLGGAPLVPARVTAAGASRGVRAQHNDDGNVVWFSLPAPCTALPRRSRPVLRAEETPDSVAPGHARHAPHP